MTDLQTYLSQVRERAEKASSVVQWYPHTEDRTIRGPWFRWFHCDIGSTEAGAPIAPVENDIEYCAMAMNELPKLLQIIERMKACMDDNIIDAGPFEECMEDCNKIAKGE